MLYTFAIRFYFYQKLIYAFINSESKFNRIALVDIIKLGLQIQKINKTILGIYNIDVVNVFY